MILCLNLNAAIDKTIVVASFAIDKIHRPESVVALAGGKGCNVARALKRLGKRQLYPAGLAVSPGNLSKKNWSKRASKLLLSIPILNREPVHLFWIVKSRR